MDWLLFLLITAAAYLLPGVAFLHLVELDGVGRFAKGLLAVPVSLVMTPFLLATAGNIVPFVPAMWQVLLLALAVWGVGEALRRTGRRPVWAVRARNEGLGAPSRREWLIASFCIAAFSLVINLHRLEMFVHGDQGLYLPSWDEFRHLTVLTSVARSGLPPRNYLFPDLSLVYYYWAQILPAAIANAGFAAFSLARVFAVHAFVQTAAFLGLVYAFLRANARSRMVRAAGLAFVTVFAGFDYFVTMGSIEWWQKRVPWLVSSNEVFSLPMLYFFAPQHLAAAMAFVLALWIWKNARAADWIRAAALGVLMAFSFGTSPFVFLGFAVGLGMWIVEYRRAFRAWKTLWPAAAFAIPFGIGWIPQLVLTLSSSGKVVGNLFRVPLLETYLSIETGAMGLADRILTVLHLPVVMSWILLIEIGLPFVVYAVWAFRQSGRTRSVWSRLAVAYPLVMFVVMMLFTDQDGGGNFSRRGFIPMQIGIALAAALALRDWRSVLGVTAPGGQRNLKRTGWLRPLVLAYIALTFLSAQSVSWLTWEQTASRESIGCSLRVKKDVTFAGMTLASCLPMPEELAYVLWLNAHTPVDALIVEERVPALEDHRFLMLERIRYLDPVDAARLYDFRIEVEITRPQDLAALEAAVNGRDVLQQAILSGYYRAGNLPLFFVAREKAHPEWGEPVYEDSFVRIYRILDGMLALAG